MTNEFFDAIVLGDVERLKRIDDYLNIVCVRTQCPNMAAIHLATVHGHLHMVQFLLQEGVPIDLVVEYRFVGQQTPLRIAIDYGQVTLVEFFCFRRACVFGMINQFIQSILKL